MKKLLVIALMLVCLLSSCQTDVKEPKMKKITSFEVINLHLSGMRITEEYEIRYLGPDAEIARYFIMYYTEGNERELQESVRVDADRVLQLLNDCKVYKWDGFDGPNPPGLTDGTTFRFQATVNDGQTINACGSNNYPKRYHEFVEEMDRMLNEGEKN